MCTAWAWHAQELSDEDAWLLAQPTLSPPAAEDEGRRRAVEAGEACAVCMEPMDDPAALAWCHPTHA